MSDYGSNLPPGCESADGYTQEQAERAAVMEQEGFEDAVMERLLNAVESRVIMRRKFSELKSLLEISPEDQAINSCLMSLYEECERNEIEARLEPPEVEA